MNSIYLRVYTKEDAQALLDLSIRNQGHFEYWMPVKPPKDTYTLPKQLERIQQLKENQKADRSYAFGIFLTETNQLVGEVSAAFVERFPAETCMIGYQLDQQYNGQGIMSIAVRQAARLLFEEYQFHRLRAEVMPENIGSIRVLEKVGFRQEGIAKKSLFINGAWEDFVLFALLKEELE